MRESVFEKRWVIDPDTGCWNWTGRMLRGYGLYSNGRAARIMYEREVGPIPAGHDIHHLCHNTACVNPVHLQAKHHGRHVSEHKISMTLEQAKEIRAMGERFVPIAEIVARTGIDEQGVWKVLEGHRYPELGPRIVYQPPCAVCGKPIVGRNRRAKYCSDRCNHRASGLRKREVVEFRGTQVDE